MKTWTWNTKYFFIGLSLRKWGLSLELEFGKDALLISVLESDTDCLRIKAF